VLLVVVAGALVAPEPWSRRRRVLVAFGGISVVLLGLGATSFSSTDIAAVTGGAAGAARILTVVAVLVALPIVVKPQLPGASPVARAMVVAASLEVVLAIVIPPGQQWPLAPLWVVGVVVSTAVYALLLRMGRAVTQGESASVFVVAWLCSVAASVVAVVAARP
jgi:hypothetical protein